VTALCALTASDRAAVADLYARAADYVLLETGAPPDDSTLDDFFSGAPPGIDPATSVRMGAEGPQGLMGVAEMAFGYPGPRDAYIGLLLLDPAARGCGLGRLMLDRLTGIAMDRGADRMLIAVLQDNPRGMSFWQRQGFVTETVKPDVAYGLRRHTVHRMARALG
jgi:ribosomal protein S18 acetylase RimI-like enzyme